MLGVRPKGTHCEGWPKGWQKSLGMMDVDVETEEFIDTHEHEDETNAWCVIEETEGKKRQSKGKGKGNYRGSSRSRGKGKSQPKGSRRGGRGGGRGEALR